MLKYSMSIVKLTRDDKIWYVTATVSPCVMVNGFKCRWVYVLWDFLLINHCVNWYCDNLIMTMTFVQTCFSFTCLSFHLCSSISMGKKSDKDGIYHPLRIIRIFVFKIRDYFPSRITKILYGFINMQFYNKSRCRLVLTFKMCHVYCI